MAQITTTFTRINGMEEHKSNGNLRRWYWWEFDDKWTLSTEVPEVAEAWHGPFETKAKAESWANLAADYAYDQQREREMEDQENND